MTTATSQIPEMVDRAGAAKLLGCSVRTLDRWMAEGRLPRVKTCRMVRFYVSDLREFLDRSRSTVEPAAKPAPVAESAA